MKVLHVIGNVSASAGGTTFALRNILLAERLAGIENEVLTLNEGGPDTTTAASLFDFVPVRSFPATFPARFARSQPALRWLRAHVQTYDFLSFHSVWQFLPQEASRIAAANNVPYSVRPHGSLDPFDLQKKARTKRVLGPLVIKAMLSGADHVHCTARLEADRLETYGAVVRREIVPLPVPADHEKGDRARFRARWGWGQNDFVLLFLGRIDYKKGLDLLLPALAQLRRMPFVKLAIAGPDSHGYQAQVAGWRDQHGLQNRVVFCGMLSGPEKRDALAGGDLFVLPSRNENFGVAVIEALHAGLPVLVSKNVYIWPDVVEGGWVCDNGAESVCESLEAIVACPDARRQKAQAGPVVAARFAPAVLAPRYRALYQKGASSA